MVNCILVIVWSLLLAFIVFASRDIRVQLAALAVQCVIFYLQSLKLY